MRMKNANELFAAAEAGGRLHPDLIDFIKRYIKASCSGDTMTYVYKLKATMQSISGGAAPHDEPRAHGAGAPRQGLPLGGTGRSAAAVSERARPRVARG